MNTSRDTRLDTILDTIPDTKSGPELRSLDQLIELKTENQGAGSHNAKGVSTRKSSWIPKFANKESWHKKSSWNPDVWGPGLLLNQFQNHLLKKDQFVDDLFIIYRINQDQDQFIVFIAYGPTRIFSQFSQITGNEVSLISYRKSTLEG